MHRLDEWLDLFAEDGIYWMPLEWGQTDPRLTASLMYEDKMLLTIRIERLKGNRTFSQKPRSRCHHVLQTPQIERRDETSNEYVTWTPMHYVETRRSPPDRHRRLRGVELHGWTGHGGRADPAFRPVAALARSHSVRRRERHRGSAARGARGAGRRRRDRRLRCRRHQSCRFIPQ